MRGNAHVRFGGAGRGNGSAERLTPRPGPIPTRSASTGRSAGARTSSASSPTGLPSSAWSAPCWPSSTTSGQLPRRYMSVELLAKARLKVIAGGDELHEARGRSVPPSAPCGPRR
jgi:hypothetical protein